MSARMEDGKEDETVFLNRTSRAMRGKRMTKLLDEEIEEDELFWNQDALKEDENDENYEEVEGEVADVFDSDFDDDEPEPDEEIENEGDGRERTKKKLIFPGKQLPKRKKKVLSKLGKDPKEERAPEQSTLPEHHDMPDDVEEKMVRKSTRTSVIVRQAERDAIRAALEATMKPIIRRKKEGEEKRMTQEEMLLEAAQTEIMNLRHLERVLAREEEVKKRAVVYKAVYSGPQTRYLSRNGKYFLITYQYFSFCKSYLEFSKGLSFQAKISTGSTPYPKRAVCAVTGLPAKYRDPKTGLPYATKEAFKIIRERLEENSRASEKKSMGFLCDVISGEGFSKKQKRSVIPNMRETSDFRYSARFRTIPALEIIDDSE
ncbi:hypothetical protein RHGRI_026364 [Rhododendron griersonianum]|uniref:Vps72/YL1 C-terminal domain-containing protein n=1 Tax=Rhododendron griersonianum TaxID=479676 RepID=A0AAV6ITF6_9ERIC|nr:hypothetical protein RHGRI_026364 [Rhododendron griersonianum]KAG5531713.1 hypothetical protein RHGRI_026364 [Rhododendron griersonianum]